MLLLITQLSMLLPLQILAEEYHVYSSYTTRPPCCRDHLGSNACSRLLKSNVRHFADRCNFNAEFRLLQCCNTCNKSRKAIAYDLIARSLVSEQCFDRYGPQFCDRYVNGTDVFQKPTWNCDGENPQIAFRTCRKSCGFCNFGIVHYTLDNAMKSCRIEPTVNWRERWGARLGPAPSQGKDRKKYPLKLKKVSVVPPPMGPRTTILDH